MDKFTISAARGFLCLVTLAGLAACNTDQTKADAGAQPVVNTPVDPAPSNPNPSNPPPASPGNAAPQIAGSPSGEVAVGQAFSFRPNASDADGDALTFSIQSKPQWASFDAATGRLWGTPAAADVGSHEEIAISVSDGTRTEALPQFAIHVVEQDSSNETGSATLAWTPPTQNTDGTALTNLKGYKIHYGTQSGNYDQVISITNAGLTRYTLEGLESGRYFFAISAVAANGTESSLSGEASKTI